MQNKTEQLGYIENLISIFGRDWKWCLLGGVLSFALASVLMTGWPEGLIPNLSYPYSYDGDGFGFSWQVKRSIEGWYYNNPRSGYPFGSLFLDYPGTDNGNLLILKFLGMAFGSYYAALNVYFLTGFVVTFISAFCVMRFLKLGNSLSFAGAFLFNFLPFHIWRIGHLFYTWYFVVPLYFYFGFIAYFYTKNIVNKSFCKDMILPCSVILLLSSFGVYYALFGVVTVLVGGVAGSFNNKNFRPLIVSLCFSGALAFGVLLNLAPNYYNTFHEGPNHEVAQRSAQESETYGLKLVQLLLPRADHRLTSLGLATKRYNAAFPFVNENSQATLGFVGSCGFILLLLVLFCHGGRGDANGKLALLSLMVVSFFFVSTIGGFGVLFAMFISPAIRSWNRISVFVGFGSIIAFFILLEIVLKRLFFKNKLQFVTIGFSLIFLVFGVLDQTVNADRRRNEWVKRTFLRDRKFIASIESLLPPGSPVFQLPYMPFPEAGALHNLSDYGLAVGYLHSKRLRWSYAGMKGRKGDLFYRFLAKEPLARQLEIIRKLGFQGIYIDKRGYQDYGKDVIHKLILKLNTLPTLTREDGAVVFFRLNSVPVVNFSNWSSDKIMRSVGYVVDEFGPRYPASLYEGFDFRRNGLPSFVKTIKGMSVPESWGRWSDANDHPSALIEFYEPLPPKFTLHLAAQAYGPNLGKELTIKVGSTKYLVPISKKIFRVQLDVNLEEDKVTVLEFIPPVPVSPKKYENINDPRKLGIGLIALQVIER